MELVGFVYDNAGNAIAGATVQGYESADDQTSGTTAETAVLTDSNGKWTITTTTASRIPMDVRITYGSNKRWIKAGDKINVTDMTVTGELTVGEDGTGFDVTLFGDTPSRSAVWDQSEDALHLNDSTELKFGSLAAGDMVLYHDGTNSYIKNATGALKLATESTGIAVTIGHTTSEVTIGQNLTVTGTLTLGSGAELSEAELELLDGITAGTAAANKAVVLDGSKNIATIGTIGSGAITATGVSSFASSTTIGNLTLANGSITDSSGTISLGSNALVTTGVITAAGFTIGAAVVDATELEILDGALVTTAELNVVDGNTSVGTTAVSDGHGIVMNHGGTMAQTNVVTLAAYLDDEITAMPNLVTTAATTVGVLANGSIDTGFGTINNAAAITGTVLTATTNFTMGDTVVTNGVITDSSGLSLDADVTVTGDLIVNGDTVTVNTATLSVEDPLIALAIGNGADSVDVGLYAKYTDSGVKYSGLFRDASDSDKWKLFATTGGSHAAPTTTVNTTSGFTLGTLVASAFEGDITGDVTGNADTATALATTRAINGVNFDGSAAITVTAAAGTLSGNTLKSTVVTSSLTTVGTIGTGVWQGTAIASGYIAADAITGAKIADDAIGSEHIADDAVVTAAIADDAITSALIADDAVVTAAIADDAITSALIADDAVVSAAIADNAITNALMADNAIDSAELAAGSVDAAHMSVNSIDSDSYVNGSIDTAHYAAGSVDATALGADSVTAAKIGDNVLNSEHYAAGSIDNEHLADDAVDSDEIAAGAIDTAHIADNQVTLAKMAGGTDGNIISYDASGDPVAIATGNDGQVLTSTGAGSPPAFEALPSGDAPSGAQTGITTILNAGAKLGRDSQNLIDFATTDNKIILRVNNVDEVELVANVLQPTTNDGVALGTGSLMWSDAFLASGSVLNFNNGNMTVTHSNTVLTVAGGTLATAALTTSTIVASGIIKTDDSTPATTIADGSLQTDGGLSVTFDAVIGDDLILISDAAKLSLGIGADVTLTHDNATGGTLSGTPIVVESLGASALADDNYTGLVLGFIAHEDMDVGQAVYIHTDDGEVGIADANALATMPAIGVVVGADADADAPVKILVQGIYNDADGFDGALTEGATMYLGEAVGAVTVTIPDGDGDFVQVMGVACGPRDVYINPSLDIIERAG